jgi:hypothetical protein
MDKSQTPKILRANSDTSKTSRTPSEVLGELEGFYEYAASLRSLWHWIELLAKRPDESSYFHEYLMEEIELGDGFTFCPGTIEFPIAPSFPNADTPSKRALEIAITQIQWYLVGFNETACASVDRLCNSLPYCESFKSKIRLEVGKAKRDWNRFGSYQECVFAKAVHFQQAWGEVVNVLLTLGCTVDTELNIPYAEGKNEPPPGFSCWLPKKEIASLLDRSFRSAWENSGKPGRPTIIKHPDNEKLACYRLP